MTIAQQLNVKEFPFEIKDSNGNVIYWENSNGYWTKREYDTNGNVIYFENSNGYWCKSEYDTNGNVIYCENSDGYWAKREWGADGVELYFEDSDGYIEDNRPKPEPCVNYIEDTAICDSYGEPKGQCVNCGGKDHEHPDHFAETSKKIDDACKIAYKAMMQEADHWIGCPQIYERAWKDALAWKGRQP